MIPPPADVDDVLGPLFAAERRRPGPTSDTEQRVKMAVLASIAAATVGSAAAATTTVASASASSGLSAFGGAAAIVKPAGFVIAAVVATAGGAVFVAHYEPAPPAVAEPAVTIVVQPVKASPPAGLVVGGNERTPPKPARQKGRSAAPVASRLVEPPAPVVETPAVETPAQRSARLAEERALITQARAALSQNDAVGALVVLEAHRATHPRGALAEEREALTVMALARSGRLAEAQARTLQFTSTWPGSLFAPALAAALKGR